MASMEEPIKQTIIETYQQHTDEEVVDIIFDYGHDSFEKNQITVHVITRKKSITG